MTSVKYLMFVLYMGCTFLSVFGLKNEEAARTANDAVLIAFQNIHQSGGLQRVLQSYKEEVPEKVRELMVGLEPFFEEYKDFVDILKKSEVLETAPTEALIGIALDAVHKAGGPQKILEDGGQFIKENWHQVSNFTGDTVDSPFL